MDLGRSAKESTKRCTVCDRAFAEETARYPDDISRNVRQEKCWSIHGETGDRECRANAVDWRSRTLAAEAELDAAKAKIDRLERSLEMSCIETDPECDCAGCVTARANGYGVAGCDGAEWPAEGNGAAYADVCEQRDEAEAAGRRAERALVIRWLRNICAAKGTSRACLGFEEIAEAIEDEEHVVKEPAKIHESHR